MLGDIKSFSYLYNEDIIRGVELDSVPLWYVDDICITLGLRDFRRNEQNIPMEDRKVIVVASPMGADETHVLSYGAVCMVWGDKGKELADKGVEECELTITSGIEQDGAVSCGCTGEDGCTKGDCACAELHAYLEHRKALEGRNNDPLDSVLARQEYPVSLTGIAGDYAMSKEDLVQTLTDLDVLEENYGVLVPTPDWDDPKLIILEMKDGAKEPAVLFTMKGYILLGGMLEKERGMRPLALMNRPN